MKKIERYKEVSPYIEQERLPVGGYVLQILDINYQTNEWGDTIVLSFDIAEGEQAGFYTRNYKAQMGEDKKWKGSYRLRVPKDDGSEQDEWTMKRFKTVLLNFEESNPGYHWDWDEQTLKGKKIGALFNNKEYELNGRHGFFTNCHSLVPVERIRSGRFAIPEDTLLKRRGENPTPAKGSPIGDGFLYIPDNVDDDGLPFH